MPHFLPPLVLSIPHILTCLSPRKFDDFNNINYDAVLPFVSSDLPDKERKNVQQKKNDEYQQQHQQQHELKKIKNNKQ